MSLHLLVLSLIPVVHLSQLLLLAVQTKSIYLREKQEVVSIRVMQLPHKKIFFFSKAAEPLSGTVV